MTCVSVILSFMLFLIVLFQVVFQVTVLYICVCILCETVRLSFLIL